MATNYPNGLDTLSNPSSNTALGDATIPHAAQHANANDAIEAIQTKVGISGSTDPNSHENRISTLETNLGNALGDFVPVGDVGQPDGVASLDSTGNVPLSQLGNASHLADAMELNLGTNTSGSLNTSAGGAINLTTTTKTTNGITLLNQVLGKLVPAGPSNFPNGLSPSISSSTYSMRISVPQGSQQTNGNSGVTQAAGSTITTTRSNSVSITGLSGTSPSYAGGPGDSGILTMYFNNNAGATRTFTVGNTTQGTSSDNGTYTGSTSGGVSTSFSIFNNVAYPTSTPGFWEVFGVSSASASSVPSGWNTTHFGHSSAGNTSKATWYYDSSTPGTPVVTQLSFTPPVSPSYTYSSTIPMYNNSNNFTLSFTANKLSGDCYPVGDTFVTGASGGAFQSPSSITYSSAGIPTPLSKDLYVSSGEITLSTTAQVASGFDASSNGPSVYVSNGYNTGMLGVNVGSTILFKTGTSNSIEESNVIFGSTVGTGSGAAARIINPGSSDTPSFTANSSLFNGQTSTLQSYDATVVSSLIKHDQTNYSVGYLPVGPDLSSGRSGAQYYTFKFIRTALSKFDIKFTGTISGMWVALPGSTIDTSSTLNGWVDMSTAYAGSGIPGAGTGGNGSNGCATGGTVTLNSSVSNHRKTCTFGTLSTSNTATNEVYVRIKLTTGQSISALSLETASN